MMIKKEASRKLREVICDLQLEQNVIPEQSWERQHPNEAFDGGASAHPQEGGPQGGPADLLHGWKATDAALLVQPVQKLLLHGQGGG